MTVIADPFNQVLLRLSENQGSVNFSWRRCFLSGFIESRRALDFKKNDGRRETNCGGREGSRDITFSFSLLEEIRWVRKIEGLF